MKMHYDQFSVDPRNQALMIYSLSAYFDHTMSLFRIASNEKKPTNLDHPYPEIFFRMDFVGCCSGLVCMGCPPLGQGTVLWNPAMKVSKFVRLSKVDFGVPEKVSLGFGYDAERGDFKVVRIVCLKKKDKGKSMGVRVEVYSANSDSWKTIKVGFQFRVLWTKNDAIVNGNPYWVARVDENESAKSHLGEVLVWFDVSKMVFNIVPLSTLNLEEGAQVPLVDWKGALAALVYKKNKDRVESVDVWVFDDGEQIWRQDYSLGPIETKVDRLLRCSKNGKILGECPDGKLFLFDPETGCVKEIVIDEAQPHCFEIYGYTESLAYIKGMGQVVTKKEEEKEEDEDKHEEEDKDEEDDEDSMAGPVSEIEVFLRSYLQLQGSEMVGNYPLAF